MRLSVSRLKAYSRCPLAHKLERDGAARKVLSRTAYGSVMHVALLDLEKRRDLAHAQQVFAYYWHPSHIDEVTHEGPVTEWMQAGREPDTYGLLRARGLAALEAYWKKAEHDADEILGLEYEFWVPVGTRREHVLHGIIDRLSWNYHSGRAPQLNIRDYKTGRKPEALRYDLQFTGYDYASRQPEFWDQMSPNDAARCRAFFGRGDTLRTNTWIDLSTAKVTYSNAGERDREDFARLHYAADQLAAAYEHDIFPPTISGAACRFCEYRGTSCPPRS